MTSSIFHRSCRLGDFDFEQTGDCANRFEKSWDLPSEVAEGYLTHIEFRPGFSAFLANYKVKDDLSFFMDCPKPAFGLGFCVSGSLRGKTPDMPHGVTTNAGQSHLFYFPDQRGFVSDKKSTTRLSLSLIMDPKFFYELIKDEIFSFPRFLRPVAEGAIERCFCQTDVVNSQMYSAFLQFLNCPFKGTTRRLFLESKAMELTALRLENLKNKSRQDRTLTPEEMDKIRQAADLLDKNQKDPPSLFCLAKTVGLSHGKLNQGFRVLFGTTAFGYLRQVRLDNAKRLLETRRMNVTEAAFEVGYNSLSSFSRAFMNQYGLNPNSCHKKMGVVF
ncbi:helix-turn-helix transcriptional regulator [Dethiosulfatarculus sandiegensis]|uniref:AraC family transcriptional regulator n=1 Tax=Dethiosulfatarculus sandiegensis TaxID=1429043 RepID=A0A0D2HNE8_9BACT|nr:AraC family transcriptional regulator [Dethiosulfatarculus sandiegensis]KIX12068.1 AraC family transcriptional regulator [Dethiosulfatarculus sandiegensis]